MVPKTEFIDFLSILQKFFEKLKKNLKNLRILNKTNQIILWLGKIFKCKEKK